MKKNRFVVGLFLLFIICLILGGVVFLASRHSTEMNSQSPTNTDPIDLVVIEKTDHRLSLFSRGQLIRTYGVALGRAAGAKIQQGDHKTPVGKYKIVSKNQNSQFHLSMLLSYPNELDKTRAQEIGVDPGNSIEIHGLQNGLGWIGPLHRAIDWTDGCIAVTDEEIEEINSLVQVGTTVVIYP